VQIEALAGKNEGDGLDSGEVPQFSLSSQTFPGAGKVVAQDRRRGAKCSADCGIALHNRSEELAMRRMRPRGWEELGR
jgi:hypothetical protein